MLSLILAVCSSALVSLTMRFSESRVKNSTAMLAVNYMICTVLSWAYTGFSVPNLTIAGSPLAMGLGAVNGMLYLAGFVLLQVNIRKNGVVLSSTFMKLGLLVSMLVSVLFFREQPELWQWLGFFLAVAAIILINYRPGTGKAASKWGLILALLAGGSADAMSKIFEELGNPVLSDHFLLYTFLAAFLLCVLLTLSKGHGLPGLQELGYGALIGIPNFFSAKFMLSALGTVPAVIVYPVCSVGTILAVTAAGVLLFREWLEKRQWIALILILIALSLLKI
ncbi:MAG: EamA family transporter [Oscillospiraceae bacterium]|nr:EamA family transporter [Oscillospiraceae bacterium]